MIYNTNSESSFRPSSLAPPVVLDLGIAFSISGDDPALVLEAEKEFTKKLLTSFKISRQETLVGFMKYGRESKIVNNFGTISNKRQADREIDAITLGVPGTNLVSLFKRSRTQFFQTTYGARYNVPKSLLLFIGDESGILPNDVNEEVMQLQQMGVKIILVAIGNNTDFDNVKALSTSPDTYFFADGLPELEKNAEIIAKGLLPGLYFVVFILVHNGDIKFVHFSR